MSNYRVSRALNDAMRSGSGMVIMTPEQVEELMTSGGSAGGGSGGSYRGRGRGRAGYNSSSGRGGEYSRGGARGGRVGYSSRDGARGRTESYEGSRSSSSYYAGHGEGRQHQAQDWQSDYRPARNQSETYIAGQTARRYEPYHGHRAAPRADERRTSESHQHGDASSRYSNDGSRDYRSHHQRSHSDKPIREHKQTRDDHYQHRQHYDDQRRSPRSSRELESSSKSREHHHQSDRYTSSGERHNTSSERHAPSLSRDEPRMERTGMSYNRGRGMTMLGRGMPRGIPRGMTRGVPRGFMLSRGAIFTRSSSGFVNKYDFNKYKADRMMMAGTRFMTPYRGGLFNFRGNQRFMKNPPSPFNAYYYCRMCERRYYGNREAHKISREHKESVQQRVLAIERERREANSEAAKDLMDDFLVMDEVGESDDEGDDRSETGEGSEKQEEEEEEEEEKPEKTAQEALEDGEITEATDESKTSVAVVISPDSRSTLNQNITPDISKDPLGLRYVISVGGFFCKLCSKFYHDEKTAKTVHVKTPQHLEKVLKAAKEAYTKSYLEKKNSETTVVEAEEEKSETPTPTKTKPETKVKPEAKAKPENKDDKKAGVVEVSKESSKEDDARKAGKAAASAKIAAVTANARKIAPSRRVAGTLTRKTVTPLRAKRIHKINKKDAGAAEHGSMDCAADEVVKSTPEEGEITDEKIEIDETALDRAAPELIPGLDVLSSNENMDD